MNDPWAVLRRFTQARIGLGRDGSGLPTTALLEFQLAHAKARDAVHVPRDLGRFADEVRDLGVETVVVETAVTDRGESPTSPSRPQAHRGLAPAPRGKEYLELIPLNHWVTPDRTTCTWSWRGLPEIISSSCFIVICPITYLYYPRRKPISRAPSDCFSCAPLLPPTLHEILFRLKARGFNHPRGGQ